MSKIFITLKNKSIVSFEKDTFELVKSLPKSIAKGKCFLIIPANEHCHEISEDEFNRVSAVLDPDDVDKWEAARIKHEKT